MKKDKYTLFVDEKKGKISYTKYKGNKKYVGEAFCHPNDRDVFSEKIGMDIAYFRSEIKYLQDIKNTLSTKLALVEDLYSRLLTRQGVTENSPEMKGIRRQIYLIKRDIEDTKCDIQKVNNEIQDIINNSEDFSRRLRNNRKKKYATKEESTK
jgi:hypothetical protein